MTFKPANIPTNDSKRVQAVARTGVLDTNSTELYDVYCLLAKEITGCPVSWTGVIAVSYTHLTLPTIYSV